MSTRQDVADLMRNNPEWLQFFKQCCYAGHLRLRSQARQWQRQLHVAKLRGQEHTLADIEDALWELARDLLPDSPAAAWDTEWAGGMASKVLRYLAENYPECSGSEELHPYHEAVQAAEASGERPAYYEALREYVRAGRAMAVGIRGRAA